MSLSRTLLLYVFLEHTLKSTRKSTKLLFLVSFRVTSEAIEQKHCPFAAFNWLEDLTCSLHWIYFQKGFFCISCSCRDLHQIWPSYTFNFRAHASSGITFFSSRTSCCVVHCTKSVSPINCTGYNNTSPLTCVEYCRYTLRITQNLRYRHHKNNGVNMIFLPVSTPLFPLRCDYGAQSASRMRTSKSADAYRYRIIYLTQLELSDYFYLILHFIW